LALCKLFWSIANGIPEAIINYFIEGYNQFGMCEIYILYDFAWGNSGKNSDCGSRR